MTVRQLLEKSAARNAAKVFVRFGEQEITYGLLDQMVNRTADGFLQLGIKKGDRVCLMLRNSLEFLYAWFALAKIGGVMVPLNTSFKREETRYVVQHAEANTVITSAEFLDTFLSLVPECPAVHNLLAVGEIGAGQGIIPFGQILASGYAEPCADATQEEDPIAIMYTSGTTGNPKGCILSHDFYLSAARVCVRVVGVKPEDRLMVVLPLYHANAQYVSTLGAMTGEASIILIPHFSASQFWDEARRYGATEFNAAGGILSMLMKQPPSKLDRQHSLSRVLNAGTPREIWREFEERFNVAVIECYGQTETDTVLCNTLDGLRKVGSIGTPTDGNEVKVVDDEGREAPPGEIGELICRGPVMFGGYYKDPVQTQETVRDGWFHTGDNGYMDSDGYCFFLDRKKDIIRRRGENISSFEVERVINDHPSVLECAVIGVPSELGPGEEEVKAYIVLRAGLEVGPADIVRWVGDKLSAFKVPRYIEFRESFPKTPTERVRKFMLKREKADPTAGCWDRMAQA